MISASPAKDFAAIPVIDMAPLVAGDAAGTLAAGKRIHDAAVTAGFFYVRNHGVPAALIAGADAVARRFFALPDDAKRAAAVNRLHRGFIAEGEARMYGKEQPDLKESFVFGLDLPADDPDVCAGKPLMGANLWPPAVPEMKPVLDEYLRALCACGRQLLRGFATALGLPADYFAAAFAKPLARGSLIYYPPQRSDRGRYGVAPHSDYGCLTLLWQDANGGLEVRNRAGGWIPAAPMPDTLVVNIGDLMARWTDDLYASNPHRVVNRSGRERHSMAVFFDPHPDTPIAVLESCRRPGAAAKYPPTTCGAYIAQRFDEAFRFRTEQS